MFVIKTLIITDVKTHHWNIPMEFQKSRDHRKPQVKKHIKFENLEMFEAKVQITNMTDIEDNAVFTPAEQLY